MQIRDARAGDADRLAELVTELGYPSAPGDLRRRLEALGESELDRLFVAVDAGERPLGLLHAVRRRGLTSDEEVEIAALVVASDKRSCGVGSRLLEAVEQWARELGVAKVRVRSNVVRERTHQFYLRAAYAIAKTSLVFEKSLSEGSRSPSV